MSIQPKLNKGEYVFVTVSDDAMIPRKDTIAEIKEAEGITMVLLKQHAEQLNLVYDFIASWITLDVQTSLDAVGLTAVFSKALADEGLSCNVLAGYYHDHIFVDINHTDKAMTILSNVNMDSKWMHSTIK